MRIGLAKAATAGILTIAVLALYQNCSGSTFSNPFSSSKSQSNPGNGDGYGGLMPARYASYDTHNPCTDSGADGDPLPNSLIFVFTSGTGKNAQLVRNQCADLTTPQDLNPADLQFSTSGAPDSLTYANTLFVPQTSLGDFDVIVASCPAGRTPLAAPTRQNLISSSQNLMSTDWSDTNVGIGISLSGVLGGLPRFQIIRNDVNNLDTWRRIVEAPTLSRGKTYAFTFFAEPGIQRAKFIFQRLMQGLASQISKPLMISISGSSVVQSNTTGQNVTFNQRSFAGGKIFTTYFIAPTGAGVTALGITPYDAGTLGGVGQLGDSIFATALQLEDVSDYCQ